MSTPAERWSSLQQGTAALFDELVKENAQLRAQTTQLNESLDVYKQAQRVVSRERDDLIDSVREAKARATTTHQASLVSVLVDGDGAIFTGKLLARGRDGGREAAQLLRSSVEAYAKRFIVGVEPSHIVAQVFVNQVDLGNVLETTGTVANATVWSDFVVGFNQAHPLFSIVDCGRGKEGADAKMREGLKLYASMPSCGLVLFAGCHDSGYAPLLQSLQTEGLLSKVVMLNSYADVPIDIRNLRLPSHTIDGLFMPEKLVAYGKGAHKRPARPASPQKSSSAIKASPRPADASIFGTSAATTTPDASLRDVTNGLRDTHLDAPRSSPVKAPIAPSSKAPVVSPAKASSPAIVANAPTSSPVRSSRTVDATTPRPIDPTKPLHKQNPPVCNNHHLSPQGCKRDNCPYGHFWKLTPAQLGQLAQDAKQSPCSYALRRVTCPDLASGHGCHMGHRCPRGPTCVYLKQGRCRFNAPGMHGVKTAPKTPVKTAPPRQPADDSSSAVSDDDEVVLRPHGGFDI